MWKKLLIALIIILLIAVVAWQYFKPAETIRVQSIKPTIQSLSTSLDLNAVVINDQIVSITALSNGEIGQIKARAGESVKKGQLLALLDNQQAQSLLNKARAELDYARQKLSTATRSYTRIKNLSQAGNTSRQNLDDALDTLRSSEAEVTIAEASATLAELALQNSSITAPFDGVVTEQHTDVGQWVEAGTPLFTLVAKDAYLIEAQVDASDWSLVSIDQSVSLTTESAPDKQWESSVSWIAPTVAPNDRDSKAVAIRFPFGPEAPPLLLGQEVDAELVLEEVENALTLPLSAMVENKPGEYIVFVARNNEAKQQAVEVGLQNATHAEILSGIGENDTVIVARQTRLTDGLAIEVD